MRKWSKRAFLSIALSLLLLPTFALSSHASYQALRLDGNGYASIADASQAGLDMDLSDFMIEFRCRIKSLESTYRDILHKYSGSTGYILRLQDTGRIQLYFGDGSFTVGYLTGVADSIIDDRWHTIRVVFDRSGNAQAFIDGVAKDTLDISGVGNCDNAGAFRFGEYTVARFDELRIWNFGYGGLPSDYADYIAWRAQGRNVFKDISEYNSGSWNGYTDADRTDVVTDGGLENWASDTDLTSWIETNISVGVRDIDKSTTKHGGSYAAKLEATLNDGTYIGIRQVPDFMINKYYSLSGWVYFPTRTAGSALLGAYSEEDGSFLACNISSTNAGYVYYETVFELTGLTSKRIYGRLVTETTTGIVYFDDISVKRTGLVGRWRFNGDYTDETVNANTLVEGGSGNVCGLGYTLKREKIISPYSVR